MDRITKLKSELQSAYLKLLEARAHEYISKKLNGRLVLEIRKGEITNMFDQAVIAGSSAVDFYMDKISS